MSRLTFSIPGRLLRRCLLVALGAAVLTGPAIAQATVSDSAHNVTVTVVGGGSVSGPGGVACPGTCGATYAPVDTSPCPDPDCNVAQVVTLNAAASVGWHFAGWSATAGTTALPAGCGTATSCTLDMVADYSPAATFADAAPQITLTTRTAPTGVAALTSNVSDDSRVVSVAYAIDGVPIGTSGAAPFTVIWNSRTVGDGPHTLVATVTDDGGLTTSATEHLTVDQIPPTAGFNGGPADGAVVGPNATLTWTGGSDDAGSGVVAAFCRLDDAAWGPCTTSTTFTVTNPSPGPHTVGVLAYDRAGLSAEGHRAFTVDATAPTTTITDGPSNGDRMTTNDVRFTFVSDDLGARFECRLYPASPSATPPAFGSCTGAGTYAKSNLSPGSYSFEVRGADAVGNVEALPEKRTFTIVAPAPPGVQGAILTPQTTVSGAGTPVTEGIRLAVSYRRVLKPSRTTLTSIHAIHVPAGATVQVRCKGLGCPKHASTKAHAGTVIVGGYAHAKLRPGAVITVVVRSKGKTLRRFRVLVHGATGPTVR